LTIDSSSQSEAAEPSGLLTSREEMEFKGETGKHISFLPTPSSFLDNKNIVKGK
jgi:hypothetical protein